MKRISTLKVPQSPPQGPARLSHSGGDLGGFDFSEFINNKLNASINVMLLCVLESERSSPGRQGFKMALSADGEFFGTIGGGMMEQKFVEKAKHLLAENETKVLLMR